MWTKEIPTEPGYYWWRLDSNDDPELLLVHIGGSFFRAGSELEFLCDTQGGEWYGPLTAPEGNK